MGGLRTVIGRRSVYNNTSFMCVWRYDDDMGWTFLS